MSGVIIISEVARSIKVCNANSLIVIVYEHVNSIQ